MVKAMRQSVKRLVNLCLNISVNQYHMAVEGLGVRRGLVVDLGCGDGALLRSFRAKFPHHDYVGVDASLKEDDLEEGIRLIRGDLFDFVNSGSFAEARIVILNDVLEHLTQEEITRLFSLFQARLKDGAIVFCQFPNCASPFGWRNQSGDPTHMTILSAAKFDRLISAYSTRCHYRIVGVDELGIAGHPIVNYASGLLYYKVICKALGRIFVHSIGWNRYFWQPNLMVRITYGQA
jgi:SAM-dependent methyltransferase